MSSTRHLPLPSFVTLALGAGTAAYAVLHDTLWLLASAALLACASALLLVRRWHMRLAGALLACLGVTATASSAAAVLAAYHQLSSDMSSAAQQDLLTEEERADLEDCPDSLLSRTSEACARIDARRALARGVMRVYTRGPTYLEWNVRLLAEHRVTSESIGDDDVPPDLATYAKGYNEIMIPAMREKFGAELFDRMSRRVRPAKRSRLAEVRNAVVSVDFGYMSVTGGLDKNVVRRHVRQEWSRIQACYQRYTDPRLSGTVVVAFDISPRGAVVESGARGVNVEVSSCVAEVIDSIQFPEPEGAGPVSVGFPLKFGPERGLASVSAAPQDVRPTTVLENELSTARLRQRNGLDQMRPTMADRHPERAQRKRKFIASVKIGHASSSEGLDKNTIRRYVRQKLPLIKDCYERHLKRYTWRSGKLLVDFQISPRGAVIASSASGVNKEVSSCVAEVIAGIQFPKPKGTGPVEAKFPFLFSSDERPSAISMALDD